MKRVVSAAEKKVTLDEAAGSIGEARASFALMNAVALLKNPKSNAKDVAIALRFDPKLSESIIIEVNSPYYGLRNKVENLDQAIALLGFKRINDLLKGTSTHEMYKAVEDSYHEMMAFKRHGIAVACIAENIAASLKLDKPEEFFQAGMMHDIGKYIYLVRFPDQFKKLVASSRVQKVSLFQLEKETFGFNHCQLGDMMADAWGLDDHTRAVIKFHEEITPKDREALTTREGQLVEVLTYANLLSHGSKSAGMDTGARANYEELPSPPGILTKEDINQILNDAETQFTNVIRQLGI